MSKYYVLAVGFLTLTLIPCYEYYYPILSRAPICGGG